MYTLQRCVPSTSGYRKYPWRTARTHAIVTNISEPRQSWAKFLKPFTPVPVKPDWEKQCEELWSDLSSEDFDVMRRKAPAIIQDLSGKGWTVCPGFLDDKQTSELRRFLQELWSHDKSNPTNKSVLQPGDLEEGYNASERNDLVAWLDDLPTEGPLSTVTESPELQACLSRQQSVMVAVNAAFGTNINDLNGIFAIFPPKARFVFHIDDFPPGHEEHNPDNKRVLSCIVYLNEPNWQVSDGGCLRLYHYETDGRETYTDVPPTGGSCVVFWSDAIFHEVLPTTGRPRFSLTTWGSSFAEEGQEGEEEEE